jgi:hypothetical protein
MSAALETRYAVLETQLDTANRALNALQRAHADELADLELQHARERDGLHRMLDEAGHQLNQVAPILRGAAASLPLHGKGCLCELCRLRGQLVIAADEWDENA